METASNTISAEMAAAAIVAAARAYGDDAIKAFEAKGGPRRRCLTAAADGLHLATNMPIGLCAALLGVSPNNVSAARRNPTDLFRAASVAARTASRSRLAPAAVVARSRPAIPPGDPAPTSARAAPIQRAAPSPPAPPIVESLAGRILTFLANRIAATAPTLATCLNAKELIVGQTLNQLRHENQVIADPLTDSGLRGQLWRLAGGEG
jgi:hypothetical protein